MESPFQTEAIVQRYVRFSPRRRSTSGKWYWPEYETNKPPGLRTLLANKLNSESCGRKSLAYGKSVKTSETLFRFSFARISSSWKRQWYNRVSSSGSGCTMTHFCAFRFTFLLARRWAVIVSKIMPLPSGRSEMTERAIANSPGVLVMIWLSRAFLILPSLARSFLYL